MGMGFQFEQHRLGLWDLSWDLKKNKFLGNRIRTPLHDPLNCSALSSNSGYRNAPQSKEGQSTAG